MNDSPERISRPIVMAGAVITLGLALSVHAVMLQVLHVPYPYSFPHTGWARLPDGILYVGGAMYLSTHLPPAIRRRSFALRFTILFLLLSTIHEVLFRAPFMEFINLSNFTLYPFIDNLPKLLPLVVIAAGVELLTNRKADIWLQLMVAASLAMLAGLVVAPLSTYAFTGVLHFTEAREGVQRYGLPYDWHILLPAYLTFFEPVIAALAIGFLVRRQLPRTPLALFSLTAALIVALKGPVFAPLLNIHYAHTAALTAFLSYAQFSFETLALGILTALTLELATRHGHKQTA